MADHADQGHGRAAQEGEQDRAGAAQRAGAVAPLAAQAGQQQAREDAAAASPHSKASASPGPEQRQAHRGGVDDAEIGAVAVHRDGDHAKPARWPR
ncbi:hypothetical protein LP420_38840 [Massilia sp. B-10]|nr:hypothetical protein LP420_38840 [Massilia sp. B-10]